MLEGLGIPRGGHLLHDGQLQLLPAGSDVARAIRRRELAETDAGDGRQADRSRLIDCRLDQQAELAAELGHEPNCRTASTSCPGHPGLAAMGSPGSSINGTECRSDPGGRPSSRPDRSPMIQAAVVRVAGRGGPKSAVDVASVREFGSIRARHSICHCLLGEWSGPMGREPMPARRPGRQSLPGGFSFPAPYNQREISSPPTPFGSGGRASSPAAVAGSAEHGGLRT